MSLIIFLILIGFAPHIAPCGLRQTEYGAICVCNSNYCDTVPEIRDLTSGQFQLFTTTNETLGFQTTTGTFSGSRNDSQVSATISNLTSTHQTMIGFGGAFTDAFGINLFSLPELLRKKLMEAYFGEEGIRYSVCRVPIGGTDFSLKGYTYCDEEDETLDKFSLQAPDLEYKLPLIKIAKELRGSESLKLFASAWTSPAWMKTNNQLNGRGNLKAKYYDLWAQYYLKFFDEYEKHNVTFWAVTTQNEPSDGLIGSPINNIGWTTSQMKKWVSTSFGPLIRNSTHKDLKIILHDDNRALLPLLQANLLSDEEVVKFADGVGVHYYVNFIVSPSFLNYAKSDKKELFLLSTEACEGSLALYGLDKSVKLGSWTRAEGYLKSIMDDIEYGSGGFIDWNMALDETGGPTYIKNMVDSPIIVNAKEGEFYKNPMFYAMGHFSRFVVPDSVRLHLDISGSDVKGHAFLRPDGRIAVVLWNKSGESKYVKLTIINKETTIQLAGKSISTLLYTQ